MATDTTRDVRRPTLTRGNKALIAVVASVFVGGFSFFMATLPSVNSDSTPYDPDPAIIQVYNDVQKGISVQRDSKPITTWLAYDYGFEATKQAENEVDSIKVNNYNYSYYLSRDEQGALIGSVIEHGVENISQSYISVYNDMELKQGSEFRASLIAKTALGINEEEKAMVKNLIAADYPDAHKGELVELALDYGWEKTNNAYETVRGLSGIPFKHEEEITLGAIVYGLDEILESYQEFSDSSLYKSEDRGLLTLSGKMIGTESTKALYEAATNLNLKNNSDIITKLVFIESFAKAAQEAGADSGLVDRVIYWSLNPFDF